VLQTLDILIGFTLVMLIMSAAVTMLTQFFGTWLLNLKGVALREVIARLLTTLDRGLAAKDARSIADHILREPLVAQPPLVGKKQSLAVAVHREELLKLILDFASGGDLEKASKEIQAEGPRDGPEKDPTPEAKEKLRLQTVLLASLKRNGLENPEAVLSAVRGAILQLEKTSPELSNSARAAAAFLNHAASDFLAKINSWFDQTMDRAVDLFTVRIRMVAFVVSVCVALLFQLNTFQLINRLSVDKELRDRVVAAAIERAQAGPPQATAPPTSTDRSIKEVIRQSGADQLEEMGLIAFPHSPQEWIGRWDEGWPLQLLGILLSAALLSLGAPFWYSMLANLLKLRSVIAGKDDAQRAERQTGQAAAPGATLPPAYRDGEAGDLTATG
jgi:hypothetical protein